MSISIQRNYIRKFHEIYSSPSKVNLYLKQNSDGIEKNIRKKFKELSLYEDFAIYANGGFGRKEMFPNSDIDISIVEIKKTKNYKNLEVFISFLWDQGHKIGHSVRSISDIQKISKTDLKEFTSYLTRRSIISNTDINKKITNALSQLWSRNNFYNEKFVEQQKRHSQFFSTAYNLEPDLKESPGTLRDFQSALWILQHCFDLDSYKSISKSRMFDGEFKKTIKAYNFIKALRFATNSLTNKNRLNFEAQIDISKKAKLGKKTSKESVEKMMKKFYENAAVLSYFNDIVFEKYNERMPKSLTNKTKDIVKYKNKISLQNTNLKKNPHLIFELFIEIGKSRKINAIDTNTKSLLKKNINIIDKNFRKNLFYAEQFKEILRSEYNLSSILKTMKILGILQKYIPDFSDVVGQMQFDLFHVYTVDEHTFKLVRNMRQMKLNKHNGFELEHELINKVPKIEILYIAGIFHDLGKGKGGDHSKIGAKISFNFAKRIGMSSTDANLISWLVDKHLIMSSISQKNDISDNENIKDFAEEIGTSEKLDYLYLLTINDIRATNPSLWNGWKHQLLKDLYLTTRSRINKEPVKASKDISHDRKNNVLLGLKDKDHKYLKKYFKKLNDNYFNKNNTATLRWQSELILKNKNDDLIVGCKSKFNNLIEIFIKVDNTSGLFFKLTKILEHSGLEIIDANIFTSINKEFAANTFITKFLHHDRPFTQSDLKELSNRIIKNFDKFEKIGKLKTKSKKSIKFQNILTINESSNKETGKNLVTIETSDRQGLLSEIANVFFKQNVSILSARINTLGDRVEDTFEIENFNANIVPNYKMKKIKSALKKVL